MIAISSAPAALPDEIGQLLYFARRKGAVALRSVSIDVADHFASKQGALPMTIDSP